MFFGISPVRRILDYRKILIDTTIQEIKKKYAGSILGLAWIVIYPILFLGIYTVVYSLVFKIRYPNMTTIEYICIIFSGLLLFLGFNESVVAGTQSVVANSGLIKNTMFPIELIPVRTVLCNQTTQGAGLFILIIGLLLLKKWTNLTPLIILIWFLEFLMEIGISWILSSLNVVVRDIQNIIGILMLLLMMASPIAYPSTMLPEGIRQFMMFNPLYFFIIASQNVLVLGISPSTTCIIGMLIWSIIPFVMGYHFFLKMKGIFVDNV